ncbi:AsmA family protein [Enterovibrio sp. ZSDZ35]|uniref:AsmA family protein n=1 Tax=Enterovibrio qingdaonensis TaxID=2899818 RepID=A0ABT5QRH3_9GAMM|nr:AsmA family protein [Enterovibrio sp. ZSDZ35]MDD1783575.1 AsmA family protein [Enterovibrio sp. ZSDZ35]
MKLFASVFIVVAVALLTLVALLHTQYGLTMVKHTISTFSSYTLTAEKLHYDITQPFSLTFDAPSLRHAQRESAQKDFQADSVSITLAPLSSLLGDYTLNSLVIKGADFTDRVHDALPTTLAIKHVALDSINYSGPSMSFKDAAIQLTDWTNSTASWGDWRGQFLFSSASVEVDGLPVSNVLLDSERAKDGWEIWGISFNSSWGNITGSATLSDSHQWLFHQLTLSDARLEYSESLNRIIKQGKDFAKDNEVAIRRFDLLDISASFDNVTIEHLNASIQDLALKQGELLLPDTNALISFNASLLRYKDWVMTDILSDVALNDNNLDVNAFSTKIDDNGFFSFSGSLNASSLLVDNLVVAGLNLDAEDPIFQSSLSILQSLDDIQLNNVTVKHTQLQHLDKQFPLQAIGLNLRGQDIILKQAGHPGLWQGKLSASAASASINRIPISSPYFSMTSDAGKWQIDPISLSFLQGQLSAKAQIDLSRPSLPWQFTASGLSIPNDLYTRWLGLPLNINGEHDIEMTLSGLADNEDSFAYSLSGELTATPHRLWLHSEEGQSLSQSVLSALHHHSDTQQKNQRPLATGVITLNADRGRISLPAVPIKENTQRLRLSGNWDLVSGDADLRLSK